MTSSDDIKNEINDVILRASPEVQSIVADVYRIEKQFLYRENPVGVKKQVTDKIKERVA